MMNTWTHATATLFLASMALIIHLMIRNSATVSSLDTTRLYTMVRERGDLNAARALVSNEATWLSTACRASVSKTLPTTDACVEERRRLRNGILEAMQCFRYSSQVCSYLRNITAGIIQNRTTAGTTSAIGRDLSGAVPSLGGMTYRQLLYEAIDHAPYVFYNSYRAEQPSFFVSRTVLYTLVVFAILGNLLVHMGDQWEMHWGNRLLMRLTVFAGTVFVPSLIFMIIGGGGSFLIVGLGIWLPAFIVLVYYEAFLDATITRPWIHPFTFCVIYTAISILALTENDVLNTMVIGLAVAQAQAVSMLYMQIVWYWAGKNEKYTHRLNAANADLTGLYTTKEMQYALYLALIAVGLLSVFQTIGPFDYNCADDLSIRAAPGVFLMFAVWGTLYLQEMCLDDEYGKDVPKESINTKSDLIAHATRITGGKLGVSLLLIAFGVLYELNILGEYFRSLRAYTDKIPDRAWQFDTLSKYTIGTGFLPAPTLYL